jgi:hypothetical protein
VNGKEGRERENASEMGEWGRGEQEQSWKGRKGGLEEGEEKRRSKYLGHLTIPGGPVVHLFTMKTIVNEFTMVNIEKKAKKAEYSK